MSCKRFWLSKTLQCLSNSSCNLSSSCKLSTSAVWMLIEQKKVKELQIEHDLSIQGNDEYLAHLNIDITNNVFSIEIKSITFWHSVLFNPKQFWGSPIAQSFEGCYVASSNLGLESLCLAFSMSSAPYTIYVFWMRCKNQGPNSITSCSQLENIITF